MPPFSFESGIFLSYPRSRLFCQIQTLPRIAAFFPRKITEIQTARKKFLRMRLFLSINVLRKRF